MYGERDWAASCVCEEVRWSSLAEMLLIVSRSSSGLSMVFTKSDDVAAEVGMQLGFCSRGHTRPAIAGRDDDERGRIQFSWAPLSAVLQGPPLP